MCPEPPRTTTPRATGDWNGKAYVGIARNYRPDHLAILPDMKGACSIADGAGLCRNHERGLTTIPAQVEEPLLCPVMNFGR